MLCMIASGLLLAVGGYSGGVAYVAGQWGRVANEHADLARSIRRHQIVDAILARALSRFDASRGSLLILHGYTETRPGEYRYASTLQLVIASGEIGHYTGSVNLPIAAYAAELAILQRGEIISSTPEALPPGALRDREINRGLHYLVLAPITDTTHHLVAVLALAWLADHDYPNGAAQAAMNKAVQQDADEIGGLFGFDARGR